MVSNIKKRFDCVIRVEVCILQIAFKLMFRVSISMLILMSLE